MQLGDYDRAKPVVIDPPLAWSTYYGGNSFDGPRAIWCDNINNLVYVVGYTNSTTMPVLNPGSAHYQGTAPAGQDAFVWKFTQAGVRLWATYYGGSRPLQDRGIMGLGPADEVIAALKRFKDVGVTDLCIRFSGEDQREQLERFSREVLPAFQ